MIITISFPVAIQVILVSRRLLIFLIDTKMCNEQLLLSAASGQSEMTAPTGLQL